MTEPYEEFRWLSDREPLGDIYCVSFVRGLSPDEALRRFGVDESTVEEATFDELNERSAENAVDAAGYIGAVKIDDWTVVIEPGGWKIAVDSEIGARVSQGTEVVSVCRHDYAEDTFTYLVDGKAVVSFDPLDPETRSGGDPDRFVAEMREVGLNPDHDFDGPSIGFPIGRSFALARRITGLRFSPDVLNLRFLGAEPLEE
ncbi:DUF6461 domain-containing protein [Sphaerisporangium sp. NBC_01403]|uniref:DUF6461 domain-containing protein n=1 Tax=Sphaerisporangium sp. NBC_01403 TaxID=2903599 RepID=UPI00325012CB